MLRHTLATALVLAGVALPAAAEAEENGPGILLRQRLALVLNPMGAEHYMELGARTPLGDQASLLFTGAHLEGGALTALSPVYATGGGYLEASPLSFLVLRTQVAGQGVWPIGMDGAGHYGLGGYGADFSQWALPADAGGSATGFFASASGTLQGMVPIGGVRLLFLDEVGFEYAELGEASFYYDQRNDLVRARADWLVTNTAFLGVELDASEDLLLRFGVYDDLRDVPASGRVANQVGPIAMLSIARPDKTLRTIDVFVRGGYYTHHALRADELTVLGGVQVRYDLASFR